MRFRIILLASVACLILVSVNSAAKGQASVPYLVRDINDRTSEGSYIRSFMEGGDVSYIDALTGDGSGFWITDGTPVGTSFFRLVTTMYQGQDGQPYAGMLDGFTFFGGCLDQPDHTNSQCGLLKTDGTPEGTIRVADLVIAGQSSLPNSFVQMGGRLFFIASGGLWFLDTADAAPFLVICSATLGGPTSINSRLWVLNDRLYFVAADAEHGMEVWVSDGTLSGTTYLFDLWAGDGSSYPQLLLVYKQSLYFVANSGPSGYEVWEYNQRLGSLHPISNVDAIYANYISMLKPLGDQLIFQVCVYWEVCSLQLTDGYTSHPLFRQQPEKAPSNPSPLGAIQTPEGERFLFFGQDANNVYDLWITDGTETGTTILFKGQLPIPWGNWTITHNLPAAVFYQGRLFFSMNALGLGTELWQTDGSSQGTTLVKDIRQGLSGSHPRFLGRCGARLCFVADDGDHGEEVWSTDGSTENTNLLEDFTTMTASSYPGNFTGMGDWVYFVANDEASGPGLWRTDGTRENTNLVWLNPVSPELPPLNLTVVGSQLYFTTDDLIHGKELWVSNGTPGGAHIVQDIAPGAKSSSPVFLTPSGDLLFFVADDGIHGPQVWRTNGTLSGTIMLTDLTRGPDPNREPSLYELDEKVIFYVSDHSSGKLSFDLWVTDGTVEGTWSFYELENTPYYFTKANGKLFFENYSLAFGSTPWQTDGTLEGTRPIPPPICLGDFYSVSDPFTIGNSVFWVDSNPDTQKQTILKTSGDILSCVTSIQQVNGFPRINRPFYDFNGKGIFAALESESIVDFHLWVTDGTAHGTHLFPGDPDYTTDWASAGPFLYLRQYKPETGDELWVWDGSDNPPYLVADILPGAESSHPNNFFAWKGKLYFSGSDGLIDGTGHGLELWAYDIPMELFYLPIVYN